MQKAIPPILFALFVIICIPIDIAVRVVPGYFPYDIRRIGEIAFCLLAMIGVLALPKLRATLSLIFASLQPMTRYLLAGLFICGAISCLLAGDTVPAWFEFNLIIGLIALSFIFAACYQLWQESADVVFVSMIFAACVLMLVQAIVIYYNVLQLAPGQLKITGQYLGFINPRFFQQFQIWTFPFLLAPIFFSKQQRVLAFLISYLLLGAWLLLGLNASSKGFLLCLLLGVIICCLVHGHAGWRLVKHFSLIAIVDIILRLTHNHVFGNTVTNNSVINQSSTLWHGSVGSRLAMWQLALDYCKQSPWFGTGPMHYAAIPNSYGAHPHNFLFTFLAEWGIPATLIVIALLAMAAKAWLGFCRHSELPEHGQYINTALTFSLASGFCYALVSGVLVMPVSQTFAALIIAWAMGRTVKADSTQRVLGFNIVLLAILTLVTLSLVLCLWQQVPGLPQREINWLLIHRSQFFPRFWLQGWA